MKKENKNLICDEDASQFSNDVYNKKYMREKVASRFAQSGRSMIEMLGVLSIIGVLSVGGYSMVKKMQDSYDTNKVLDEISTFVRKARTVMRDYDESSDGNENKYLCKAKAYPDGITLPTEGDECGSGSFEGTANVTYSFTYGADTDPVKNLFNITISGLSEDLCMQVATADWGNASSSGFKGMKIGENEATTSPYSLGAAADKCINDATITLYYR